MKNNFALTILKELKIEAIRLIVSKQIIMNAFSKAL
jgi:hypothetical protein